MTVGIAAKLYPVKLMLQTSITIMVCSLVANEVINEFFAQDAGSGEILFSILPALNNDHEPVANSELIKMSRGFLVVAICAFAFGLVSQVVSCRSISNANNQVRQAPSAHTLTAKIFAAVALLAGALLQLPAQTQYDLLIGDFQSVKFATMDGVSGSGFLTCLFYAGVLAFSDGMFALKIPAIASS